MINIRTLAGLAQVLLLSGCIQFDPYRAHRDPQPDVNGVINEEGSSEKQVRHIADPVECDTAKGRCVNFVEFDELGNADSRTQFNGALLAAKNVAKSSGVVIVYIHGWHHNAKPEDSDIKRFKTLIDDVKGHATGIYIGWRGESINSRSAFGWLPSYAGTFWERKDTAHDIGNAGAVAEFIRTLSDIRSHNENSRLLIIGHSFGGALLYSSMSDAIAEQIRRDCQRSENFTPIADLVILVNPAFEAMRIRPLYSFARSFEYPLGQPPRLFIITTKADFPTREMFKWGRYLGTLFKRYPADADKAPDVTAIGHYKPYITHQLQAVSQCNHDNQSLSLAQPDVPAKMCIKDQLELTRCDKPGDCSEAVQEDHYISRGQAGNYIPHRFPLYNIRTTEKVIPNHTDIWEQPMKLLMLALIGAVEDAPDRPLIMGVAPTNCGTPTGEILPAI